MGDERGRRWKKNPKKKKKKKKEKENETKKKEKEKKAERSRAIGRHSPAFDVVRSDFYCRIL